MTHIAITDAIENQDENRRKKYKQIIEENEFNYKSEIGSGGFGYVAEVEKNGKHYAMKIITKKKDGNLQKELVKGFRGKNIVKIYLEFTKEEKKTEEYYFYIMERSYVGDLHKLNDFLYKYLIFKEPFIEKIGDNLTRYLTQQMVTALKTFYLGNLVHLDIKPSNVLIFKNLTIKLSDFSLLKVITPGKKEEITGGTFGYRPPESYLDKNFDIKDLQKQDYFAIGMTLYCLKYGKLPIKDDEKTPEYDATNESIELALDKIKRDKNKDKDFIDFLCNLIQHKPEDRLDFEHIIRNKWLNKNTKEIEKIININEANEKNIILELQKSDFIINYRKNYRKNFDERNNNKNENKNNKEYKQLKKGKFKFGKKS